MWESLISGGLGLLGGLLGGKKKEQADPLAGIRAQLQGLAGQVPGLVARQKEQNAKQIEALKKEGYSNIGEDVYATRGFGKTSIEDRLRSELAEKLARAQSEADLNAEKWGLGQQASILEGTASMYPGAEPEEESWFSKLGKTVGSSMDSESNDFSFQKLADSISGKTGKGGAVEAPLGGGFVDYLEQLKNDPGIFKIGYPTV